MVAIVVLSQQLMIWREQFVTLGMSVQRISPKSAKQWNSPSPFGGRWRKRTWINQNCFGIDINEQIYLLNTLWLFSFYEIIVSQFSCNQMKLDRKRKFESFFDVKIFICSRVSLSTLRNWSKHNFFSFVSIDLKFGMLTKIWLTKIWHPLKIL